MNMPVDELNEIMYSPLIDLLTGPYQNKLAAALSKSRSPSQILTPQLLHIISKFSDAAEEGWNEVLARLLKNNLTYGYQTAIGYDWMLPLLCQVGIEQAGEAIKDGLWGRIKNLFGNRIGQASQKDLLIISSIQNFINSLLKIRDPFLHKIFLDLSFLMEKLDSMLIWTDLNWGDGITEGQIALKCHIQANKLMFGLIGLIQRMQQVAIRKNYLNDYEKILGGLNVNGVGGQMRPSNYMQLCWKYLPILIRSLLHMQVILRPPPNYSTYYSNRPIFKQMLHEKTYKLIQNFIIIWRVFLGICNIGRFGRICEISVMKDLIELICVVDIILLNDYNDKGLQMKYLSDQIFIKNFSGTLSGYFLRTVLCLCKNVPSFFIFYFNSLCNKFNQIRVGLQKLVNGYVYEDSKQLMNFLLKIGLLSDGELMMYRRQEIQKLMKEVIDVLSTYWNNFGDMEQMQVLRCFIGFVGKKQGDGIWGQQFAEDLVKKCIDLCLTSLRIHQADEENLSLLQQQSKQILLTLPQSPNVLRVLRSALTGNLLQIFMGFPVGSETCVQIFNTYIVNVPQIVVRDSSKVVWYYVNGFKWAIERYGDRNNYFSNGNNIYKNAQKMKGRIYRLINKLLQGLQGVLNMGQDINCDDLIDGVVKQVLVCLQNPMQIDFEQGLLRLLYGFLMRYPHFSSQLAMMICKLPVLYQKNNKKLPFLHKIYRVLSVQPEIVKEIMYEYDELLVVMLNMVKDYFVGLEKLHLEQILMYEQQLRKLIGDVSIFIQGYDMKIMQNERLCGLVCQDIFSRLLNLLKKVCQNGIKLHGVFECILQICMTISHLSINPCVSYLSPHPLLCILDVVKNIPFENYLYIQSIYMIPMLIVDQMFIQPDRHQDIVSELLNFFYKISGEEGMGGEGGMKKQWRDIEGFEFWTDWPKSNSACGQYIETVLRQMRARKVFQLFEHQKYLQLLKPFLG